MVCSSCIGGLADKFSLVDLVQSRHCDVHQIQVTQTARCSTSPFNATQ